MQRRDSTHVFAVETTQEHCKYKKIASYSTITLGPSIDGCGFRLAWLFRRPSCLPFAGRSPAPILLCFAVR
jgi:uncharacterized protein (DUF427 family)